MKKFTQFLDASGLGECLSDKTLNETPLVEAKLSRVFQYVEDDSKPFGIVSAARGENSPEENENLHTELKKQVRAGGYGYIELRGGYTEGDVTTEELSLLVPKIKKTELIALGRANKQHSVMYKDGTDFYYIGTNETSGVGKVLERFRKGEGQDNLELAKHKVMKYFSQIKKGSHSDKKFLFNTKPEEPTKTAKSSDVPAKVKNNHKPGDVWKTSSGVWGGMDVSGNYEYFDDAGGAAKYAKKHRVGHKVQEQEEWSFAKAAYLRRDESPKWITIFEE